MRTRALLMRRWRSIVGFLVGVLLVVAAALVLAQNHDSFVESLRAVAASPPWLIAIMLVLPVGNALIVSWSFQTLMRRFGSVPFADMFWLICSAWLLNYLPMRPGLVGRLAYHKAVHRVAIKDSVAVSVALALMTGLAAAHLLLCWLAFMPGATLGVATLVVTTVGVFVIANIAADRSPAGRVPRSALRASLVLRYVDLAIWAARMWVAFEMIGHPIPVMVSVLLAAAIQLAYLFPLTGSGLGVAEWSIGLVAVWAVGTGLEGGLDTSHGITATLISRSAELVSAVPLGLVAAGVLARHRIRAARTRRLQNASDPSPSPEEPGSGPEQADSVPPPG
ncbi:MAG: hypothetical protein AAGB48_10855 [Planctomycetota bacterium]